MGLRRLATGGTRPPPGSLEAHCVWRLVSSARRFLGGKSGLLALHVRGLQGFGDTLKVACWCSLSCGSECKTH